jgi:hypothetical protein
VNGIGKIAFTGNTTTLTSEDGVDTTATWQVRGPSPATRAEWTKLRFMDPPVPYPEMAALFDSDGDGKGDSLYVKYNRGFKVGEADLDSLPQFVLFTWGSGADSTVAYYFKDGAALADLKDKDKGIPAGNMEYWKPYALDDTLSVFAFKPAFKDSSGASMPDSVFNESTSGVGKFSSYSLYTDQKNRVVVGAFSREVQDSMPAVVIGARYTPDETKGCGEDGSESNACRDKLVVQLSEPVWKDSTGGASDTVIANPFAFKLLSRNK